MARFTRVAAGVVAVLLALTGIASAGPILDRIKARGAIRCGVQGPSNPGFGQPDAQGRWAGFNIDMCRGVASLIFNDPERYQAVPVTPQNRFAMIQSGEADILTQNTTFVMTRDTQLRLNFPAITLYDAQAIMVPRRLGVDSALRLDGATICVLPGTTNELNLNDWFQRHNLRFTPVVIDSRDDLRRAYAEGRCDGFTSDATTLAAQRRQLPVPGDHIILPEAMSREPLGIAIPKGDEELRQIVTWMFNTLVNAEEMGVTQANVRQMAENSRDPEIRRMLGIDGNLGTGMGVDNRYAILLISTLGNYGEIFERHIGPNSPLGIPRGLNRLWNQGGILYAPPDPLSPPDKVPMTSAAVGPALAAPPRRRDISSLLTQLLFLLVVAAVLSWLVANVAANLSRLGLQLGFGFLDLPAGFRIGESVLPFEPRDSYGRALLVGLANTLRVALLGCVLASILGFALGILRLSRNPLLAFLSSIYVETIRNTPVLLQLVLWHALILRLPPVRSAAEPLPGVFLSQRGLNLPWIETDRGLAAIALGLLLALALTMVLALRARRTRERTGRAFPVWPAALALLVGAPFAIVLATGWAPTVSTPRLQGFNFVGGAAMTPEYAALLVGLVIYGAAFIGEIVRSSIQAIGPGQWDAGRALGLREARTLRLVIVPQALRLMVPPLTNQYVNLTKNTSLGVVVGFPELASITNTVINQTGQAIEALAIFMGVFLVLSLTTSALMNWYNARVALVER